MLTKAVVIFVDIRGFTSWSADSDVHANVVEFVNGFDDILISHFRDYYRKLLGDGAMLVQELDGQVPPGQVIGDVLDAIQGVEDGFATLCDSFYTTHGVRTRLHLGWGVTRGDVWSNRTQDRDDYLGKNINEAARLCSQARPYGIIIDSDDFREIPPAHQELFTKQPLNLDGFDASIEGWVTEPIASRINPGNPYREHPEVFVSGICCRREQGRLEVLAMKRDHHREFFPGVLELTTGGQLAKDETFVDAVKRHCLRELGLEVDVDTQRFATYEFSNRDGELIPGVRYLCWVISGTPLLVRYEEFHWLTLDKLSDMPDREFLPGSKKDAVRLLESLELEG